MARVARAPAAKVAASWTASVLSGPNLDRLGTREPSIYGSTTLPQIHARLAKVAAERGGEIVARQSNHEGQLIDWLWAALDAGHCGVLLNPGAYTHTSYALYDAIKGVGLDVVEIHLSNPEAREPFRSRSLVAPVCVGRVAGFGADSYELGLLALIKRVESRSRR